MPKLTSELNKLLRDTKRVHVATTDSNGIPHIAIEKSPEINDGTLEFNSWFCHRTVENLNENPKITISIWNEEQQEGFQIEGKRDELEEIAMLNGYQEKEEGSDYPQIEYRLTIEPQKIIDFAPGPHKDKEVSVS